MELNKEVQEGLSKARHFVLKGVEQILTDDLDELHGVSPSPGATALASLALLAAGKEFESAQQQGVQWLRQNGQEGWGKFPGDQPDQEITRIVRSVLQGSRGGWLAKITLLSRARQFSNMILSLGQRVVPGLEGPVPEEILLPTILEERVLRKLPLYGRPVVVAASILASDSQEGMRKGVQYLLAAQMSDGSWAEDIIATSLALLAVMRVGGYVHQVEMAARWLVRKQYPSGGWPAFDQLKIWAVGWAVCILGENKPKPSDLSWLNKGAKWLKQGQNSDGSYGSTPPFTHPDLDDTSVALMGMQVLGEDDRLGVDLLQRLQNADGSWGTFPSFQGKPPEISSDFPVYISSVDVSIHVLEALWKKLGFHDQTVSLGLKWVLSQQDDQGAFPGSWFEGNIYSTAQALELFSKWNLYWECWNFSRQILAARRKSLEFIIKAQDSDGGWGSVVETGLALSGLWRYAKAVPQEVMDKGLINLLTAQKKNGSFEPSYRGVYAKGWNYEEPLTTALTAIRAFQRYLNASVRKRSFFNH